MPLHFPFLHCLLLFDESQIYHITNSDVDRKRKWSRAPDLLRFLLRLCWPSAVAAAGVPLIANGNVMSAPLWSIKNIVSWHEANQHNIKVMLLAKSGKQCWPMSGQIWRSAAAPQICRHAVNELLVLR